MIVKITVPQDIYAKVYFARGEQGPQGATGPQGVQGSQGPTGLTGAQGLTGPAGATGATGPQGIQGIQGIQGLTGATGAQGANGGSSSHYHYKAKTNTTSGDPTNNHLGWNNATQTSSTALRVSHIDQDNQDDEVFLDLVNQGDILIVQDKNDSANYQKWEVTGTPTYNPTWDNFPVTLLASAGTGTTNFANNESVLLIIISVGAVGPQGPQGIQGVQGPTGPQGPTGATGATGPAGTNGTNGTNGQGVPTGGSTGQVLAKIDGTNYNTQWVTPGGGGSGFTGAGTSVTGVAGTNVTSTSDITGAHVTFKTGNASVTDSGFAETGKLILKSGDAIGSSAQSGDVEILAGNATKTDSEGGEIYGSVDIGFSTTEKINIGKTGNNSFESTGANEINIGTAGTATNVRIGSTEQKSTTTVFGTFLQPVSVAAKTTSTTLTYLELLGLVITSNGTSLTLTLPTATNMDSIHSLNFRGFEWSVINLAATALTVANNTTTHARVGSGTVAASASARFLSVRTGSTWTSYRIA
jgi:hypothetical protein